LEADRAHVLIERGGYGDEVVLIAGAWAPKGDYVDGEET
jgi:hypothetical protein